MYVDERLSADATVAVNTTNAAKFAQKRLDLRRYNSVLRNASVGATQPCHLHFTHEQLSENRVAFLRKPTATCTFHYCGISMDSYKRCGRPRFSWSQIRLNAYPAGARKRSPAFICSEVVLMTYVTPRRNFLKTLTAHAFAF